ncbi:MAG: ComEA family DNA-binding protein [Planctomycetota bacterium]
MPTGKLIEAETIQKRIQSFAFTIAVAVCILLVICFILSILSDERQISEITLENRINPNEAAVASLVRLPGIGAGRAEAIVAYRQNFTKRNENMSAFQHPSDLQKVKGIGPKTVEKTKDWLKFE